MKTLISLLTMTCVLAFSYTEIDHALYSVLRVNNISTMEKPEIDSLKAVLGQKLFFDKILSGNKDISCATCHHPSLNSADGLALPIGVGGSGLGETRIIGYDRTHIPRNSPEVFNRGASEWHTMFWDSRVAGSVAEGFESPVDEKLPEGFDNVLAVQAMFPVTSRDEMRGEIGDRDVNGIENELALISPAAPNSIWLALMKRLLAIPEYVDLFKAAYPDTPVEELGFQHAANAIAAFEIDAFTFLDSPWDHYIAGDNTALTEQQKLGALLFFGKAGCGNCHSGNLLTDQEHHNIGIPQFGPGRGNAAPLDVGRFAETGKKEHRFAFRTPPLRNVAITAPYMHNGAYDNLYDAIVHHLNPEKALKEFDSSHLPEKLQKSYQDSEKLYQKIVNSLDPILVNNRPELATEEINALVVFMNSFTEKGLSAVSSTLISEVPSGLPVDQMGRKNEGRP